MGESEVSVCEKPETDVNNVHISITYVSKHTQIQGTESVCACIDDSKRHNAPRFVFKTIHISACKVGLNQMPTIVDVSMYYLTMQMMTYRYLINVCWTVAVAIHC